MNVFGISCKVINPFVQDLSQNARDVNVRRELACIKVVKMLFNVRCSSFHHQGRKTRNTFALNFHHESCKLCPLPAKNGRDEKSQCFSCREAPTAGMQKPRKGS